MKRHRYFAGLAALVLSAAGLGAGAIAGSPTANAATGCSVAYTVQSQWSTGFVVSITITNLGSPLTSWSLGYSYSGNQQLSNGWNGTWSQSGENVTVTNASYNGSVATNGTVNFGAQFSYSGTNTNPTAFTVNGVACTGQVGGGGGGPGSIMVNPTSLSVTQGSTGTVGVSLSAAPSANVTVSVTSTGNTGLTASPTSLTFTPSNFATAQNVTITADSSGTGTTTFTLSATGFTSVTVSATESAAGGGGSGPAPQLHVSGNKLLDANGKQVTLWGVNRSGAEYSCVNGTGIFDGEMDQAAITAIKSWGSTAVRMPLNEACWNGESYVNSQFAGANYQSAIKAEVNLMNSNGLVVILDLHWTDGDYTGNSAGSCPAGKTAEAFCQKPMPDAAQAIPFWTSVANTFKGNNAVIFDLFNEPFASRATGSDASGWTCWLNGGTCAGIPYQVAGMQSMVNAVRSTGASNVLMLGGEEFSNEMTSWLQFKPTDPDNNLVASWHSYNFNSCSNQSCWTSQVAPVIAQVPLIAGEIGENDCSGSYIDPLTTWLDSQHTSYLAWAWNADFQCSSGPGLITDYVPGTPTAFGAAYKAHLASLGL
ncbi:MAG: cellulase family glycosylhydrolase [Streptosporangiaceae bacterium]|nr:cellulase family glycosylhydrolase [Streptosporangiaceae bacterium]